MPEALAAMEQFIARRAAAYICVANVHTVMECQMDEYLRTINHQANLVVPDGMPLVWAARLFGCRLNERVYGPDLMLAFCEQAARKGYKNFFYGGTEATLAQLTENLASRFPHLKMVGTYAPPFRPLSPEEDETVVRLINEADPDVLWVGLGAPKQEKWMYEHRGKLTVPVIVGVGAAFNFHAGVVKQAPRWMQKRGLEWLYRLSQEPQRLWYRYLFYNPLFIFYIFLQRTGLKRFDL